MLKTVSLEEKLEYYVNLRKILIYLRRMVKHCMQVTD